MGGLFRFRGFDHLPHLASGVCGDPTQAVFKPHSKKAQEVLIPRPLEILNDQEKISKHHFSKQMGSTGN